jgi:hypothetical protein
MAEIRCDFCSSLDVVKSYACESFTAFEISNRQKGKLVATSNGKWAACDACATLIDNDHWDDLAQRSLETSGLANDLHKKKLLGFLKELHRQFKELRLKAN